VPSSSCMPLSITHYSTPRAITCHSPQQLQKTVMPWWGYFSHSGCYVGSAIHCRSATHKAIHSDASPKSLRGIREPGRLSAGRRSHGSRHPQCFTPRWFAWCSVSATTWTMGRTSLCMLRPFFSARGCSLDQGFQCQSRGRTPPVMQESRFWDWPSTAAAVLHTPDQTGICGHVTRTYR